MSTPQPYQQPHQHQPPDGLVPYGQQHYSQPHYGQQPYPQPQYGQQMPPYGQPGQLVPHGSHVIVRPMPTAPPKSGGVALILSLLICGLGQMYTGNPLWAVIWFFSAVVCGVLFFPLVLVVIPVAAVHAYFCASSWNARHHAVR